MEKFKKYINILDKGFNALSIAFMVFAIVMAALSVIGFIGIPGVIIGELEGELTLGILELDMSESLELDADRINRVLSVTALLISLQFAIACVLLKVLQKLIAPMKEGQVFHPSVAANIQRLSVYVLIGGFLTELINLADAYFAVSVYDTASLFNPDVITDYSYAFEMNGTFVVYAAIIYLLSFVFKYGTELQTQVDETL